MTRADKISTWLRARAMSAGSQGYVFGLSGGIDSAVVARLCQMALPQRVLGVLMPCYSHPQDEEDARLVASTFSFPIVKVGLEAPFDALTDSLRQADTMFSSLFRLPWKMWIFACFQRTQR